jgi:hypothetical protein
VTLASGAAARRKIVEVDLASVEEVRTRLLARHMPTSVPFAGGAER